MEGRATAIERLNARKVGAGNLPCRPPAGLLILNQRANRRLFEIEGRGGLLERRDAHALHQAGEANHRHRESDGDSVSNAHTCRQSYSCYRLNRFPMVSLKTSVGNPYAWSVPS